MNHYMCATGSQSKGVGVVGTAAAPLVVFGEEGGAGERWDVGSAGNFFACGGGAGARPEARSELESKQLVASSTKSQSQEHQGPKLETGNKT